MNRCNILRKAEDGSANSQETSLPTPKLLSNNVQGPKPNNSDSLKTAKKRRRMRLLGGEAADL